MYSEFSLKHRCSGEDGLMYADLQALEAKEVRSMPLTYFELEKMLGMFGKLLGVTLGSTHILTVSYHQFWDLLTKGLHNDIQFIIDNTGCIKPAHILCSIQLMCCAWFNHRRVCLQPPKIDFTDILTKVTLQTYITPHLPPPLFKLANPHLLKLPATTQTVITANTAVSMASVTASDSISILTNPTSYHPYGRATTSAPLGLIPKQSDTRQHYPVSCARKSQVQGSDR
jgi:hypothetical protein